MLQINEQDIDRITEVLYRILKGHAPRSIDLPSDRPEDELTQLVEYVNRFLNEYGIYAECMNMLSRGDLEFQAPRSGMLVLQSLKNLQANLRHLTWKTQQIAAGNFEQTVDFMGDFSHAFNSMTQQLREAFEKIERQNRALSEANAIISEEKEKSERLLLNILPPSIAEDLKQNGKTTPELFENVTVLFSDIVGFTKQAAALSPTTLIEELNALFTAFDMIAESNDCSRIKTIGDAYLAVCGMPEPNTEHARRIVKTGVEMVQFLHNRNEHAPFNWQIRVGIHSGPVVGAVVGVKKYIYDVFGDTINTASRMETHSEPMKINLSYATHEKVKGEFACIERPVAEVKGKGAMRMYFIAPDAGDLLGQG